MFMRYSIVVILMWCVVGCSMDTSYREAAFLDERGTNIQQIGEALMLGAPIDLCMAGDYLFVLAYSPEYWLHVYDKKTGEKVSEAIKVGRGPGEGVNIASMDFFVQEKCLYIFDRGLRKTLVYQIDGDTGNAAFKDEFQHPADGVIRKCHHFDNGKYLYEGFLSGDDTFTRYTLSNTQNELDTYSAYPELNSMDDRYAFILGVSKACPETGKFVAATMFGAVLECFDVSGTHIEPIAIRLIDKPELDFSTSVIQMKAGKKYGFSTLCLTKDLIYANYIDGTDPNNFKSIVTFDWHGREKTRYTADRNILRICPGDSPEELFGVSSSPEMEFSLVRIAMK